MTSLFPIPHPHVHNLGAMDEARKLEITITTSSPGLYTMLAMLATLAACSKCSLIGVLGEGFVTVPL